jgi:hypothetical protein
MKHKEKKDTLFYVFYFFINRSILGGKPGFPPSWFAWTTDLSDENKSGHHTDLEGSSTPLFFSPFLSSSLFLSLHGEEGSDQS